MSRKKKTGKPVPPGKKVHKRRGKQPANIPWFSVALIGMVVVVLAALAVYRITYTRPAEISVSEAHRKYARGAFMLDVREPEEWDEYHIPGATLIPLGELSTRMDELPRDQEIVVVCRTGNRSLEARTILTTAGFSRVSSMNGGLVAWRMAGYPVESN